MGCTGTQGPSPRPPPGRQLAGSTGHRPSCSWLVPLTLILTLTLFLNLALIHFLYVKYPAVAQVMSISTDGVPTILPDKLELVKVRACSSLFTSSLGPLLGTCSRALMPLRPLPPHRQHRCPCIDAPALLIMSVPPLLDALGLSWSWPCPTCWLHLGSPMRALLIACPATRVRVRVWVRAGPRVGMREAASKSRPPHCAQSTPTAHGSCTPAQPHPRPTPRAVQQHGVDARQPRLLLQQVGS